MFQKIKARLAKTVKESVRGSAGVVGAGRASPVAATHAALGATTPVFVATVVLSKAVCIPHIPKGGATVRGVVGSVEGLNQVRAAVAPPAGGGRRLLMRPRRGRLSPLARVRPCIRSEPLFVR